MRFFIILFYIIFFIPAVFADDGGPIKVKRIECKYVEHPKAQSVYFLISDDDKSAQKIFLWSKDKFKNNKVEVIRKLRLIEFWDRTEDEVWSMWREDGKINNPSMSCVPLSENFDPVKYFENYIKKEIQEQKKKNIF